MKNSLPILMLLLSLNGYTDQGDILVKGRDHFIDQAISTIKNYCIDLPNRSSDSTYICRLQIEQDCSKTSEKQKMACKVLNKVKNLEKNVSVADKNISQLDPTPLYSSKPIIEEKKHDHVEQSAAPSTPIYKQITINRGSVSHEHKDPKAHADSKAIDDMIVKINTLKVRYDCNSDSDCKVQEFGQMICGGAVGTFAYSQKGEEYKVVEEEISKFNAADKAFISNWNKGFLGICSIHGRSDPVKCIQNECI